MGERLRLAGFVVGLGVLAVAGVSCGGDDSATVNASADGSASTVEQGLDSLSAGSTVASSGVAGTTGESNQTLVIDGSALGALGSTTTSAGGSQLTARPSVAVQPSQAIVSTTVAQAPNPVGGSTPATAPPADVTVAPVVAGNTPAPATTTPAVPNPVTSTTQAPDPTTTTQAPEPVEPSLVIISESTSVATIEVQGLDPDSWYLLYVCSARDNASTATLRCLDAGLDPDLAPGIETTEPGAQPRLVRVPGGEILLEVGIDTYDPWGDMGDEYGNCWVACEIKMVAYPLDPADPLSTPFSDFLEPWGFDCDTPQAAPYPAYICPT